MTTISDDYAKLSLLAGMFAYAADHHLGRPHFIAMIREQGWSLTWEKLAAWKAEAIQMGVPAADLEPTVEILADLPALIKRGQTEQEAYDRANPDGIIH